MKKSEVDLLIVGSGPAGLAAAIAAKKQGISRVRVIEREEEAGGVPRHSFHTGYGLRDLHRVMRGPRYAAHYVSKALDAGADISTSTTALEWSGEHALALTSPHGLEEVTAERIVLATGARERGRSARAVPGTRPVGIYTTGSLQQSVYLRHQEIGSRAVIIGAEHVSFSAVMTLAHADVQTVAMITPESSHQSYFPLHWATALRYRYALRTQTHILEILGRDTVTGIRISSPKGEEVIECDVIVFTADWIPDHELARRGGLQINTATKSPIVNDFKQTSRPGVLAIGNLLLPIKSADQCALEGSSLLSKNW